MFATANFSAVTVLDIKTVLVICFCCSFQNLLVGRFLRARTSKAYVDAAFVDNTHKHCTYSAVQSIHKRGTHRTRLAQELHNIFVRLKICHSGPHMSHPLLLSHLLCTTSTSSSSFTLPSTTTPEHAPRSGQHDLLKEHPVHHEPPQDLPADKQRHQESLWRETCRVAEIGARKRNRTSPTLQRKRSSEIQAVVVSKLCGPTL